MKPKELQNLTSPSFNLQKLPGKFKNLFRKFENLTVSGFGSYLPLGWLPRDSVPANLSPPASLSRFSVSGSPLSHPSPPAHHPGREAGRVVALFSPEKRIQQ